MKDLGGLRGYRDVVATGISDSGQVVGYATGPHGDTRAFLCTDTAGLVDLNSEIAPATHWLLVIAYGINDRGLIVGWGKHDGRHRAFLLTPRGDPRRLGER